MRHVLLFALVLLSLAAWARPPEYDEAYSIFLTAGDARPAWPAGIFRAGDVRSRFQGEASAARIGHDLRAGDVHPPLYFWALEYWRRVFGPSWFAARMLSVLFTLAGLAALGWTARLADIPPGPAILLALLSYGFAYTGVVARGFALAQALNLLGMGLILAAARARSRLLGLASGAAFGAAAFSNYLAGFVAIAGFLWLAAQRRRRRVLPAALLGFGVFLPALLGFFLAQRDSRIGQFQPFSFAHALPLLVRDFGAAIYGGLPVYAGRAAIPVILGLAGFSLICCFFLVRNWQRRLSLFGLAAASVPAGLLILGLIFDNTPIEIRYLAFALPFVALLLAATLPTRLRDLLMAIQACGIIGLIIAPATMQPQGLAARGIVQLNLPAALVLLPFGNDGVGIPGPFIVAAPDNLRLQLIRPGADPDFPHEHALILAKTPEDAAAKAALAQTAAALDSDPCWSPRRATALFTLYVRTCGRP